MVGFFLISVYYILDIVIMGRKLRMIILSFFSVSKYMVNSAVDYRISFGNRIEFLEFSVESFMLSFIFKVIFSFGGEILGYL